MESPQVDDRVTIPDLLNYRDVIKIEPVGELLAPRKISQAAKLPRQHFQFPAVFGYGRQVLILHQFIVKTIALEPRGLPVAELNAGPGMALFQSRIEAIDGPVTRINERRTMFQGP